jgi:hypothetical protein
MKQELIELFESTLPKDLQLPISENISDEDKKEKNVLKQFLFGDAAINYFNTHLRPVLEKQIEMLKLDKKIDGDFVYSETVLTKYLNMLDDSDPLRISYNKSEYAKALTSLKDIGLF